MSKPISVGDLVMVVRGHCSDQVSGHIYTVTDITTSPIVRYCGKCGMEVEIAPLAKLDNGSAYCWAPPSWLKRLDPDALKDDVPTKEEIPA